MKIIGKCSLNEEQLKKTDNISEFIELQLFNEFNNGVTDELLTELFNRVTKSLTSADVIAVHAPITSDMCVAIEHIASEKYYSWVEGTVKLADMLSKHYRHRINVVLHNELSMTYFEWFDSLYQKIATTLKDWTKQYPKVVYLVENVIPFRYDKKTQTFEYYPNGTFNDNVRLVKKILTDVPNCKIYTLLDTAHAMISISAAQTDV